MNRESGRRSVSASIERIDSWVIERLPEVASAVGVSSSDLDAVVNELNAVVLAGLPDPGVLTAVEARRLLVDLGFCGSAVARAAKRTSQDLDLVWDRVRVGTARSPFLSYYAELAVASRSGHPPYQSFASIITWNVPTIDVRVDGTLVKRVRGVFHDRRIRTWTGTVDEERLWLLFKRCVALGAAANDAIAPVLRGDHPVMSPSAIRRIMVATALIDKMSAEMRLFTPRRNGSGTMSVDVFMNEIRQYGVPWFADLEAPSGPHEAEWIKRDVLLGIRSERYVAEVRSRYPLMLIPDARSIEDALRRSTTEVVLRDAMARGAERGPSLMASIVAMRELHRAAGRCSAVHLGLARKFLFTPQRRLATATRSLCPVAVSNDAGITGMSESDVKELADLRRRPVFDDLLAHAGPDEVDAAESEVDRCRPGAVSVS